MNSYQVMAIVAGGILILAAFAAILSLQGVPIVLALLGVYGFAVLIMSTMQKRARDLYEGSSRSSR